MKNIQIILLLLALQLTGSLSAKESLNQKNFHKIKHSNSNAYQGSYYTTEKVDKVTAHKMIQN